MYGVNISGNYMYRIGDTSVRTYAVYLPALNLTALYITRDNHLPSMGNYSLIRISQIQYGPELAPYGPITNKELLNHLFYITEASMHRATEFSNIHLIKSYHQGTLEPPITKISGQHIRHLTFNELRSFEWAELCTQVGPTMQLIERLALSGAHESFLVGLIVWAMCLPEAQKKWWNVSGFIDWKFNGYEGFMHSIKNKFTLKLKALQNLLPLDLTPFFELEVLVNRGVGTVDWAQERRNRIELNVVNIDSNTIFNHAARLFKNLIRLKGRPKRYSWDNFWATRWQWSPTGAYNSQYPEDEKFRHKEHTMRHKFYGFNAMPDYDFSHFFNRKPEMCARSSEKYEWGKNRAIYGVDNTNFIMSSFGLAGCEELLAGLFPIGVEAEARKVSRTVEQVLRDGVPYCFDFQDFNSQHSLSSMQAVLDAYLYTYKTYLELDQLRAIYWVRQSLENMYITGGDGIRYKAEGTLLSGWRLTTFMNTILNYIYTQVITEKTPITTTHNGDDILGAVTSLKQVQQLEYNAVSKNVRFQNTKCFLGAIAEFLRVDHRTGTGAQYLARSVATFVHGPTETVVPNDPVSILRSIYTRKQEMLSRKGNKKVINRLYQAQLKYTCDKWDLDFLDILDMENIHISLGGYSEDVSDRALEKRYHRTRIKADGSGLSEGESRLPILPGCFTFSRRISKKYGLSNYFKTILTRTNLAVYDRSADYRFGLYVEETLVDDNMRLKAKQYGMFRHLFSGTKVSLAKSYGVPIHAVQGKDSYLSEIVSGCRDPLSAAVHWG